MVADLDRLPNGSGTPTLLDFAPDVVDGDGIDSSGAAVAGGWSERLTRPDDRAEEVFGPCGGAAVYRRTALDLVGG